MARPLTIIAITGLAVSATAFVAAGSVAANSLRGLAPWTNFLDWANNLERCGNEMGAAGEENATREFVWDGGDEIGISFPGTLRYRPGPANSVIASGPAYLLGHLQIDGGVIHYDCLSRGDPRIELMVEGENVDEFSILGSGDMILENLSGRGVEIAIAGSGSVVATGMVERVELSIAGSGDADLGGLAARDVEVNIAGSGDAVVAPSERLDVTIAGSGDVELLTDPPEVNSDIFGSGGVRRR
jgi:hypothetical protein